jgi:glycine/D-amino acid oxidase-like deaminating enzyme
MSRITYDVAICGAGIAGISAAYHLAVIQGVRKVLLIDPLPPLSLTSDKSTECYRNWWPGPGDAMVKLMNRSISLLESAAKVSGNLFHLNRRGYLYVTTNKDNLETFIKNAREPVIHGAGDLRVHERTISNKDYSLPQPTGFEGYPDGADLLIGNDLIHQYYPFLNDEIVAALHVRKAGWFSAQQLGMYLLELARSAGVEFLYGKLVAIETKSNRLNVLILDDGTRIHTDVLVNAAGPFLKEVGEMIGCNLPVYCELHQKASIRDHLQIIPREAPLLIWMDSQTLPWSSEERHTLLEDSQNNWVLEPMPSGVHTRPEGGYESQIILMLWEYRNQKRDPLFPPDFDPLYPEIVLRGLTTMIPGLSRYIGNMPKPHLDGGYYTRTIENRPLIGALPVEGCYILGALSGYGLMASMAAGELLSLHVLNKSLPDYASAFQLERYNNLQYTQQLAEWGSSGQL